VSLDKKDVRLKISAEAHAQLSAVAELKEKDISEFASYSSNAPCWVRRMSPSYTPTAWRAGEKQGIPGNLRE
jgi:hypothetical protein